MHVGVVGTMLAVTFLIAGCAKSPAVQSPPHTPFKTVMTVKQLMTALVVPTSNAVFAVGTTMPEDDAWRAVERDALALAESGNLLMLPGRAPRGDREEWAQQSVALIDAAMLAVTAAESKDLDKMAEASAAIYAVCESCHRRFNAPPHS